MNFIVSRRTGLTHAVKALAILLVAAASSTPPRQLCRKADRR